MVLTALLVLAGAVFILGKGADRTLLEASFYEQVAGEVEMSPLITGGFIDRVETRIENDTPEVDPRIRDRIKEVMKGAVSSSLNEEWAEETFLLVVEDGLAYLKGEQEEFKAVIDLRGRKEAIREELSRGVDKATEEEIQRQMKERGDEIPEGMEQQVRSEIRSEVEARMDISGAVLRGLPDEVSLAEVLEENENFPAIEEAAAKFRQMYDLFNIYIYIVLGALAVFIFLLAGFLNGLKWVGWSMVFAGIIMFAAFFGMERAIPSLLESVDKSLQAESIALLTTPLFSKLNTFTLYYTMAGVILLAAGTFIKRPPRSEE